MGWTQFEPVFIFTSIDAHARVQRDRNSMCTSDIAAVADVDRLMKFERPGWWAIHNHFPEKKMLHFAAIKLIGIQDPNRLFATPLKTPSVSSDEKLKLRLFAALAPRLALTTGPLTPVTSPLLLASIIIDISSGQFIQVSQLWPPLRRLYSADTTDGRTHYAS